MGFGLGAGDSLGDGEVLKSEGKAEGDCSLELGSTLGEGGGAKIAVVIPPNRIMNNPAH